MGSEVEPTELSDRELLEAARPQGWRRWLRRLGCPVVLGIAAWLSWLAGSWVGARTWEWLGWILVPFLFLPSGVLLSAVLAAITGHGPVGLWAETRRRVGQAKLDDDFAAVREELKDRASDQRGWVVVLRGVRERDRLHVRLRLDLRLDTAPPVGTVEGARGPRLDTLVNPPRDLAKWERATGDLTGAAVAAVADQLDGASMGALPQERLTSGVGWSGLIIQVAESANEWTFHCRELPEGELVTDLVTAAMDGLGWDPTASPMT